MFFPLIKHTTTKRLKQLERNVGSMKYRIWRQGVLERDKEQCQWAGCSQKEDLEIHHIKRWAGNLHLRYNLFNGITLCKEHHRSIFGREATYEVVFLKTAIQNDELLRAEKARRKAVIQDLERHTGETATPIPEPERDSDKGQT